MFASLLVSFGKFWLRVSITQGFPFQEQDTSYKVKQNNLWDLGRFLQ